MILKQCSYGGRKFRFRPYPHDGWQHGGRFGPGALDVYNAGAKQWEPRDTMGYMESVVALKELLMQTSGTAPQLSDNTIRRKPKKGKK